MFPQMGGGEHWLIVAVVLLLVVRPKDLPKTLREIGRWIGKVRKMANEFKASFEDMARQSELDELRAEVEALRSGSHTSDIQAAIEASQVEVDAMLNGEVPYQVEPGFEQNPEGLGELPPVKPKRVRKPKAAAEPDSAIADAEPAPTKPARRRAPAKAKA